VEILLADIVGKSEQYSYLELFDSTLYDFKLEGPVTAKILVKQQGEGDYTLSGELQAIVEVGCDRCGRSILLRIDRDFRYDIRIGKELESDAEHQCSEEECETLHLDEAAIDSKVIVAEQLSLAIPVQRLCDDSCRGLCKECGIDLNEKKCKCGEMNSNSPFAILKTLQQK
jgi:DUF177 domain-containing protein